MEATPPPKQTPRESATKYDVKGPWGWPIVFGDSNNSSGRGKFDITQDLAALIYPAASDAALKARDRGPENVFVNTGQKSEGESAINAIPFGW